MMIKSRELDIAQCTTQIEVRNSYNSLSRRTLRETQLGIHRPGVEINIQLDLREIWIEDTKRVELAKDWSSGFL
jgi:hypothetical protein